MTPLELIQKIYEFAHEMDNTMQGPSTFARGQKLARLVTDLTRAADETKAALTTKTKPKS